MGTSKDIPLLDTHFTIIALGLALWTGLMGSAHGWEATSVQVLLVGVVVVIGFARVVSLLRGLSRQAEVGLKLSFPTHLE